jgi:ribosomal protein S18 acetylase RimI-like enzyme
MSIVSLGAEDAERLVDFFGELPDGDLMFIKEDVTDAHAVRAWSTRGGQDWVALDGDVITGFVAVRLLAGWSDHVGELRLVVHPDRRREGFGRALARHALTEAVRAGRGKVVVELAADQTPALAMFASLGFTGEALLREHIRDRDGELHDLVMLAHFVGGTWATMETAGIPDDLEAAR